LQWLKAQVHFDQPALEATLDYGYEADHAAERIQRLDQAIDQAIRVAPPEIQTVVQSLQALRGIAQLAAVSLVSETRLAISL
jgi:transposase